MSEPTFRTALITGASAGMGEEFARQLARMGSNLILVARRQERLAALAAELQQRYALEVSILQADLSKQEDIERVENRIAKTKTLDLLVNNAGFGGIGTFSKEEIHPQLGMLQVHVVANVRLTRAALKGMISQNRGSIINVASTAAFSPLSGPMYGATKAFLVSFSQNLDYELLGTEIKIQALCPGFTYTEFHDVMGMDRSTVPRFMWMSAEDVVRISLRALRSQKVVCIPGWRNRLIAAPMRFTPSAAVLRKIARLPYFRKKAGN